MRRFLVQFILGMAAAWFGSILLPHVASDNAPLTFILMGFLLAVGETVMTVAQGGAALILFFLPRSARRLLLRVISVGTAAALTAGYRFDNPLGGLLELTLLLTLLLLLPFA